MCEQSKSTVIKPEDIIVVIAAYSEEKNISDVINPIVGQGYQCIVVDDGSTDRTAEIALNSGVDIIRLSVNLGQGWALLTGFKAALLHKSKVIIEMDADGQHDPDEIQNFIYALENTNHDVVIGSRILGTTHSNSPILRRLFLPIYTWIINQLTGYKLSDSMCGFRAFRTESMKNIYPLLDSMREPQYLAAELFVNLSRKNMSISEIPIHMKNRNTGTSYKGVFRYGLGVLKALLRSRLYN